MTPDTKSQLKSASLTTGIVGAALFAGANALNGFVLLNRTDLNFGRASAVFYEGFIFRTNLSGSVRTDLQSWLATRWGF